MHEILTVSQMARADAITIKAGTAGIDLMENAGRAVAFAAMHYSSRGPVLVACGTGNNGGDGFVAARHLAANGFEVAVALAGDPLRIRGDAAIALDRWGGSAVSITDLDLRRYGLVIDALFGAGLDRELSGPVADFVCRLNLLNTAVLSVDLPSGVHGDSGALLGDAVKATATVTFFRKKPGHLLLPSRLNCGEVILSQIGIEADVLATTRFACRENDPETWSSALTVPQPEGHKYDRGHAFIVSGPPSRTGAARLAASAALRIGAGLVTIGSADDALLENGAHLTEIMLTAINDAEQFSAVLADPRVSAVALGPALGPGESTRNLVTAALCSNTTTVLDADALTSYEDHSDALFDAICASTAEVVVTPHGGEFARLFGPDTAGGKLEAALKAARACGAVVVYKGADTVIAAPDGRAAINVNAPPWLATAGAGDVLAGAICGLAAQGIAAFESACAAVWIHGRAASLLGPGMLAGELAEKMSGVLGDLHRT